MRLEFPTANRERYIAKFLVLEELSEIVGQPALRHFELYRITLARDINTVRHYANLKKIVKIPLRIALSDTLSGIHQITMNTINPLDYNSLECSKAGVDYMHSLFYFL